MFGFFRSPVFLPDRDIPPLYDKTIVITGGTSGLGREQLLHVAKHSPGKLYLAARSEKRARQTIDDITSATGCECPTIHFVQLDLSSLASVQVAASRLLEENERLDILVNNAGRLGPPAGVTRDGYEINFGVNYLGPFLFTKLLLPLLSKTAAEPNADVRIINLTSTGYAFAPKGGFLFDQLNTPMSNISSFTLYGQSKLGSLLHATELARRYPELVSVSLDPGGVVTGIGDEFKRTSLPRILRPLFTLFLKLVMNHVSVGVRGQLWACVAPIVGRYEAKNNESDEERKGTAGRMPKIKSGAYYVPLGKEGWKTKTAKDENVARTLWAWSESQLADKGY